MPKPLPAKLHPTAERLLKEQRIILHDFLVLDREEGKTFYVKRDQAQIRAIKNALSTGKMNNFARRIISTELVELRKELSGREKRLRHFRSLSREEAQKVLEKIRQEHPDKEITIELILSNAQKSLSELKREIELLEELIAPKKPQK